MSNLENPALHKIELRALANNDLQTLRLVKEIRDLRLAYGKERSEHVKYKTKRSEGQIAEYANAFVRGVKAVAKLFPELPPLHANGHFQTVSVDSKEIMGGIQVTSEERELLKTAQEYIDLLFYIIENPKQMALGPDFKGVSQADKIAYWTEKYRARLRIGPGSL